jgi:hypothetical protein
MSKRNTYAGTYVPGIVNESGNVRDLPEVGDLRSAIHAVHAKVGSTHFGEKTSYDDGSYVRQLLAGPKDAPKPSTELVAIVRFFPTEGATHAKSARKAKPASKTARKSSKAAESGKATATVHFTAAQKRILLEGLKRFVNGLR